MDSLIAALGTNDFPRLSVGIGRPSSRERVIEYVLSEPAGEEAVRFLESVGKAADAVLAYSRDGAAKVMHELNRKEIAAAPDG
jgi:peptidyl-tRNA hydrolase, PTH1 family